MLRRYLAREIEHWSKGGLLQPGQGEALLADYDLRHTGFSLSGVLGVLAAVLFGAAVIALVAANWEMIARPLRVAMIFGLILAGLAMAVLARRRDAGWIVEAALVFTLLSFGAAIALVGQMYHLSGDEAAFMLTWTIGGLVLALSFSSAIAAIVSGLLGLGHASVHLSFYPGGSSGSVTWDANLIILFVAIAVAVAAWRTRSVLAGHMAALLGLVWLIWILDDALGIEPGYALSWIGAAAFIAGSFAPVVYRHLGGRHGEISAYGVVMMLTGLGIVQVELINDNLTVEIAMAALILLLSIAVLATAGRDNNLIRRFAFVAFAAETIYVVSETLGTLLGSSGFLFLGGLTLAVIAYAVMRVEKRFNARKERS